MSININTDSVIDNPLPPTPDSFDFLSVEKLTEILGLTIKKDGTNKLITFLALLSAFTENSQLNISFNAPSSSGKSFIPTEIASLFPANDVIEVGYCSPTAFFHDYGVFDKEKGGYSVDLSRKIIIFLDQPHQMLLQHLRPLLSHDKKEIKIKITDKSQKFGLKTKNIYLIGFPAVIFCTAGLKIDEQEATRFLLLSPQIDQEKIRQAITEKIKKDADNESYSMNLESNPDRTLLKARIKAIKDKNITDIKIKNPELVEKLFYEKVTIVKPRHQRDIARINNLIKIFALLNLWSRTFENGSLLAEDEDINQAYELWNVISESQELNLPPFVFDMFKDVIIKAFNDKNNNERYGGVKNGISRQEIHQAHFAVYGRLIPDWQLRLWIIPALETAGILNEEVDPQDKRKILYYPNYPTASLTVSQDKNNSETSGVVSEK